MKRADEGHVVDMDKDDVHVAIAVTLDKYRMVMLEAHKLEDFEDRAEDFVPSATSLL